jgi:hypothetical protein
MDEMRKGEVLTSARVPTRNFGEGGQIASDGETPVVSG